MEILRFPHDALFEVTKPVTVFGEELKVLLDSMWETMKANNGLGLAANQVGLPFRMFVMEGHSGRLNIVNPTIIGQSLKAANLKEGCLSAPGDFIIVPSRVDWVQVQYQDEEGEQKLVMLKDLHAVCAQHELEHLDGKSFMQHKSIPKHIRQGLKKKWGV